MITVNQKSYRELRCNHCRKLICLEYITVGRVAYLCPRCKEVNEFNFMYLKTKENTSIIEEGSLLLTKENVKGGEINGRYHKS